MKKRIVLHVCAMMIFAPCALCASESLSTVILGILYVAAVSTVISSTRIGRKLLAGMWRETLRLERWLQVR